MLGVLVRFVICKTSLWANVIPRVDSKYKEMEEGMNSLLIAIIAVLVYCVIMAGMSIYLSRG